jgi:hypothetical protein
LEGGPGGKSQAHRSFEGMLIVYSAVVASTLRGLQGRPEDVGEQETLNETGEEHVVWRTKSRVPFELNTYDWAPGMPLHASQVRGHATGS